MLRSARLCENSLEPFDKVQDRLTDRFRRHVAQTSAEPLGLEIATAEGCTVIDVQGRRYLDFLSGIGVANVGHAHPQVVAAVREQAGRYLHAMVYGEYVLAPQVQLAERLGTLAPDPLQVVYFTNSKIESEIGPSPFFRVVYSPTGELLAPRHERPDLPKEKYEFDQ